MTRPPGHPGDRGVVIAPGYLPYRGSGVVGTRWNVGTTVARWIYEVLFNGPLPSRDVLHHERLQSVKKVLVIGVHGWALFGGRMFSWSPDAMSTKLARMMGDATMQRLREAGINHEISIQHVSLSGHGLVDARLQDYLMDQLPEHEDAIRSCDILIIASHSQGAVLAGVLLDRLMERDWISPLKQAIIGLASIAGVHHGPFSDLPTDQFAATAELFALGKPYEVVSERSLQAITRLLDNHVRVVAFAAYMDNVVPLFSSSLHSVSSHPNLLRAIFFPDESEVDTFPGLLVRFCLQWRNTRPEHADLLPHLSGFFRGKFLHLSGSHSLIHACQSVYDLAAEWILRPPASNSASHRATLAEHTSAHWATYMNSSFFESDLNAYFIRSRLRFLLDGAAGDPSFHLADLHGAFQAWTPKSKSHRHLRQVLAPLFAPANNAESSSISVPPSTVQPPAKL